MIYMILNCKYISIISKEDFRGLDIKDCNEGDHLAAIKETKYRIIKFMGDVE